MAHVLIVDNDDSFTWNLVQAFRAEGAVVDVVRSRDVTVRQCQEHPATHLVLSPGPGTPGDAGATVPLIQAEIGRRPLLGVCLGHQSLVAALGGAIRPARTLMHGKPTTFEHDGTGLWQDIPSPTVMGRYHSLAVADPLPGQLRVTARAPDGEIMAIAHTAAPAWGVQFHPESILSPDGPRFLRGFLQTSLQTT